MDRFIKVAVAVAALLAGGGVFYYYVIFLPGIERQKLEMAEQEKKDAATKAQQEKQEAAQKEVQKKQLYEACKLDAATNYQADWAAACKDVAAIQAQLLQNCLSDKLTAGNPYLGESYCKRTFSGADPTPNCSLPAKRAEAINKTFHDAQEKCLNEAQLGM
ncbi:hypothetical protein [Paraburkholderia hospita]|uniref:hypothetical protein n=1 Tax=Paraburkholderia hospita TaxID=169430 RepID=UPI000B345A9A|nr:hypothetical protein [Paraburkholderia hospita]OUL71612.1 hypothetical protein CA603_46770 [Paraburkholderia hospita]